MIDYQSFYQAQLSSAIDDTQTNIPLDNVPIPSEGFLVIEPLVPSKREIIYFTSKDGSSVTVPAGAGLGRGYDGTTATSHLQNADVIMAPVGVMFSTLASGEALRDDAVSAQKMVNGMVKHRQGGTTGDNTWRTPGTSNTDTSSKDVKIQTGVVTMASSATVTFPEAFSQVPVVFLTPQTAGSQNTFARVSAVSTTQFIGQAFINTTTGATSESVAWIAIGQ